MNLARNLETSARFFPDRPALRHAGGEVTYARLNDQANRIATGLLSLEVRPGDHVGLCAPNSADWIAFYFGVLKAGGVAVTLSALLTAEELSLLVNHAKPRLILTQDEKLADLGKLRQSAGIRSLICPGGDLDLKSLMERGTGSFMALDRDWTDTAAILYTGGTTGIPKGVMLTHEGINFSSHSIAYYERSCETDLALCFMPFNHVFGQIHVMNATIYSAGCLELVPSFDMERILEAMETGRVTKFLAVPTVYVRLLNIAGLEKRIGRLRYCFSGGASMAAEVVK